MENEYEYEKENGYEKEKEKEKEYENEGATVAKCEQGYLCDVCGREVESITDSDLYLRFVLGEVRPEELHLSRERHLRCNPAVAQFIVDPAFGTVRCDGPFGKEQLDPSYVTEQEQRVTRAWKRLQELPGLSVALLEYPLPEVRRAWATSVTS